MSSNLANLLSTYKEKDIEKLLQLIPTHDKPNNSNNSGGSGSGYGGNDLQNTSSSSLNETTNSPPPKHLGSFPPFPVLILARPFPVSHPLLFFFSFSFSPSLFLLLLSLSVLQWVC
jgi:hypothetical protein